MDIAPYVEGLRHELEDAAEAAGPEARATAERLLRALDPAFRLTAMELLSHAAAEVTGALPAGVVEVRLRGREPHLVVDVPPGGPDGTPSVVTAGAAIAARQPTDDGGSPVADEDAEEAATARVTLRIPESLKTRAEEAADRAGHSLNGWLVQLIRTATSRRAPDLDLTSIAIEETGFAGRSVGPRRLSGWL